MITLSKPLGAGQAQAYHREEFGNARENYYAEGERIRGTWHGRLAEAWGLRGEVREQHFERLSEGQHPVTGEQLVRHQVACEYANERGEKVKTMEHRAGWDATFSAPKSVSLTALVGGDDWVRDAHRESVQVALDEMEGYVQARLGGNHPAQTMGKWVAAKFEHDSARPVDGYAAPQLHTHVVFFNLTETEDGKTHPIQPRELYKTQQYVTAVYRSELAWRLKHLGYEIEQGKSGQPEIKGYSKEYLEASSPRRRQIQEHLEAEGLSGAGAAEIAAHRTRERKLRVSHEKMRARHRAVAKAFGNQPRRVVKAAQARKHQLQHSTELGAPQSAMIYARERNLEREAVAEERELLRDALKRSMGEATLGEVKAEFARRIEAGDFVEVEKKTGVPGRAFTTEEVLGYERDIIATMRAGQSKHEALASLRTRREIEREYAHLSKSQRAAVDEILASRDQITALEGVAGAGKTTSLAAIRKAAEREGYEVQGLAPISRAAQKLQEAGIESNTLQHHLARGDHGHEGEKHLYILDESSLASTKQMNEFLHRLQANDRVLLVGDTRQHEAVEAGRPYRQLQEAGIKTARLDEIVRQKDPELREVVEQLASGQVEEAIRNLDRQGRVHEVRSREERIKAIAREYAVHPEGTLVVSPDNRSRLEINQCIHRMMQRQGQVEELERRLGVLAARQEMTGADRRWARQYEPGDIVRYTKGSKVLGIEAGEYACVARVDPIRNLVTIERKNREGVTYDPHRLRGVTVYRETERGLAAGDRVQLTAPYRECRLANRELATLEKIDASGNLALRLDSGRQARFNIHEHPHLDLGYVVTSHSSQGQTADRVIIHVDTEQAHPNLINTRLAYVSVSRGRHDAQIYTNDKTHLAERLARDVSHRSAMEYSRAQHPVGQKVELASTQKQTHRRALAQGLAIE